MAGTQQIPWLEYLQTYNRMYKADFKTPQEMIAALYAREGTLLKVSEIMGVSDNTINLFMLKHGLPRLPRGHRGNSDIQIAFRKIKNPERYKHRELAEMLDCSIGYVSSLIRHTAKWRQKNGRKPKTL